MNNMFKKYKQLTIHLLLFLSTLATTTLAGADWTGQYQLDGWDYIWSGLNFSGQVTFLGSKRVKQIIFPI